MIMSASTCFPTVIQRNCYNSFCRLNMCFLLFQARKTLRRLKGISRLHSMTQGPSVKKQASTTLSALHSWNRIQAEIRACRVRMVIEGRLKQKKLENQLKLEAKLHNLEVTLGHFLLLLTGFILDFPQDMKPSYLYLLSYISFSFYLFLPEKGQKCPYTIAKLYRNAPC